MSISRFQIGELLTQDNYKTLLTEALKIQRDIPSYISQWGKDPAVIYYVRIRTGGWGTTKNFFWKIGHTKSWKKRFQDESDELSISPIKIISVDSKLNAWYLEQYILDEFRHHCSPDIRNRHNILQKGNSEIFTKDILNIDTKRPEGKGYTQADDHEENTFFYIHDHEWLPYADLIQDLEFEE